LKAYEASKADFQVGLVGFSLKGIAFWELACPMRGDLRTYGSGGVALVVRDV
jgi:hypothetical protein